MTSGPEFARGINGRQILVVRESLRHFDGGDTAWTREQMIEGMQSYGGFIFVSDHCRRDWMSVPLLSCKPAFCVPNCCQEEEASLILQTPQVEVRRKLNLPADRFVAVCVAQLERRKGHDIILDQMQYLTQAVPNVLVCFIGAAVSEYSERIKASLASPPFARWMAVLPQQESAMEFIYAADALILPSRAEAMPRVVLEAMVLGTPVVASDVDGIPELVEHGKTGFLFSHENPLGLVEGLRRLASDRTLAAAMARRARQRYWDAFSRIHLMRRYAQVISVVSNRGMAILAAAANSGAPGRT